MNIVVIGLGSMGKRRIRLIKAIYPQYDIAGVDSNIERVQAVEKEYQISCMISVPLLFEGIQKNIIKEIQKQGKYNKFKVGLRLSSMLMKLGIDKRKEIFADIHRTLGGNVRLLVSGGAELSPDVQKWYNSIGLLLTQGYGATETAPIVSAGYPPLELGRSAA